MPTSSKNPNVKQKKRKSTAAKNGEKNWRKGSMTRQCKRAEGLEVTFDAAGPGSTLRPTGQKPAQATTEMRFKPEGVSLRRFHAARPTNWPARIWKSPRTGVLVDGLELTYLGYLICRMHSRNPTRNCMSWNAHATY